MVDFFHTSIASKLATDKPTGSHAARRPILCHQCHNFPFILDEWMNGIIILKNTPFRPEYTSSCLATVGFFDLCRRFLHHFLNLTGHFLEFSGRVFYNFSSLFENVLFFASTVLATNCIVSSLVSSYDGGFSRGRRPRVVICDGAASNRRILLEWRRWSVRSGSTPR